MEIATASFMRIRSGWITKIGGFYDKIALIWELILPCSAYILTLVNQRWLGARLDALGSLMTFFGMVD